MCTYLFDNIFIFPYWVLFIVCYYLKLVQSKSVSVIAILFIIYIMQPQTHDYIATIATLTKLIYRNAYFDKFKKQPNIAATVICSISLINVINNSINVVSVGFGTKSMPYSVAKQLDGKIIKDMHSEVLARRGFIKFILLNLPKQGQDNDNFEWDTKKQKHRLRAQIKIIMYVNQIFCGDCMTDQQNNLYSGARPLRYFNTKQVPKEQFSKYYLRTKPGRLDLPLDKRSLSLSCSDKVGVWNILGIQGKILFNYVKPIYINTIIIQTPHKSSPQRILQGINLSYRISKIWNISQQKIKSKLFNIVINSKIRPISSQFRNNQPELILIKNNEAQKNQLANKYQQIMKQKEEENKKFQLCGIILGEEVSWLNGRTGLPEGVSIKKIIKTSPFCSDKLYQSAISNQKQQFKYHAIKQRIKILFRQWTDDYKQTKQ